ncbi:unnamed protein product [Clonostachys rosea f. rosea IK726]|jgi:hypothetical protein|uniref:Uncharacterized protein n=2 Tax=Bionectria ochroleuca TaxID=29856 RepID=A0A8H7TUJ3_BIOOC|nr:unnamed protein product [Clonostachys rosea f. rosea IK726]
MGLSPKHQFLATAMFFAIMSGVVGAPIPPMKVLLLFPALGVVAQQLIEAWEPFMRFARATRRAILSTRSGPQRPEADGQPETVQSLEPDRAAAVFEQLATQHDTHSAFPGQSVI